MLTRCGHRIGTIGVERVAAPQEKAGRKGLFGPEKRGERVCLDRRRGALIRFKISRVGALV